ncbi:NACHT domain-containing protein [Candidatus Protochlamydia sp. R18]|uniref:NACHT domain-containing protein n=1 Tax=Candidatus Protochlamydia sp. R18 TaxID=1353977 RepID=UPI0005A6131C|nr:hypothetical protein [Candidatus Protochlamydia sp. R18]
MIPEVTANDSVMTFHLTGTVSNKKKYNYDVKIDPKTQEISANVIKNSGKKPHQPHSWEITSNPSRGILLTTISELILQSYPQINISKKKLKNHLNLESGKHNTQYLSQLTIKIEGTTTQGEKYRLDLCPDNVANSKAYLLDEKGNEKSIAHNLKNDLNFLLNPSLKSDFEQIRDKFLPHFKSRFRVNLEQKREGICLCLSLKEDEQADSPLNVPPSISLLSINNAQDLAIYLKQLNYRDPLANEIAYQMVEAFTQKQQPSKKAIEEIIEIFENLEEDDQFNILKSLVNHFVSNKLKDKKILKALSKIFIYFQKLTYQHELSFHQKTHFSRSLEFLDSIEPEHFVSMLTTLTEKLRLTAEIQNISLIKSQLTALVVLIETMLSRNVKKVDEEIYGNAYEAINSLTGNQNLEVAYLAHYGKNSFLKISDDTTPSDKVKKLISRSFLILRGIANLADAISLFEPWHIAPAFEAYDNFKEAFTFHGRVLPRNLFPEKWFITLYILRVSFFAHPQGFFKAIEKLNTDPAIRKREELHDPFFLMGLVDLLWEVLHFPSSTSPDDITLKQIVISLFQQIYQENNEKQADNPSETFYLEKKEYRTQLQELIKIYLLSCTTHPLEEIKDAALEVVQKLQLEQRGISSFASTSKRNAIFNEAIKAVPLFEIMKSIGDKLKKDYQLKEKAYYISSDAEDPDQPFPDPTPLEKMVRAFLNDSDDPVLHLEGYGGEGKTLAMKMLVDQFLNEYSDKNYFPIYTYLPRLKDPFYEAWECTMSFFGINTDQEKELKKRQIMLICDAHDEINSAKRKKINIYMRNQFEAKEISKVIFVSKTKTAKSNNFEPQGKYLHRIQLKPFSKDQIFDYLNKYVSERQKDTKKENRLLWDHHEYQENFKQIKGSTLWEVITNPFRLKITAEVLPFIVNKQLSENPQLQLKELFFGKKNKDGVSLELFRVFACVNAIRSSRRTKIREDAILPEDYLRYSVEIAKAMESINIPFIPWPPTGLKRKEIAQIQEVFGRFFEQSKESLYQECLIPTDDGWSFIHNDYKDFFVFLGKNPKELEKLITETLHEYSKNDVFLHDGGI